VTRGASGLQSGARCGHVSRRSSNENETWPPARPIRSAAGDRAGAPCACRSKHQPCAVLSAGTSATRIQPALGWRGWRAALGLLLAPLKSFALRDWETRVTGKGDVPCGARAAEVGGAPLCLVELRMPAGSAEPWLRTQLQPRSIGRPFRHERQNMPLCWALAQLGRWPASLTIPARTSGGRPHTACEDSRGQTRGWPAPGAGHA
jgi:hypothetical protein